MRNKYHRDRCSTPKVIFTPTTLPFPRHAPLRKLKLGAISTVNLRENRGITSGEIGCPAREAEIKGARTLRNPKVKRMLRCSKRRIFEGDKSVEKRERHFANFLALHRERVISISNLVAARDPPVGDT